MESQVALANLAPNGDLVVISSTQHCAEIQEVISHALPGRGMNKRRCYMSGHGRRVWR